MKSRRIPKSIRCMEECWTGRCTYENTHDVQTPSRDTTPRLDSPDLRLKQLTLSIYDRQNRMDTRGRNKDRSDLIGLEKTSEVEDGTSMTRLLENHLRQSIEEK